MELVKVVSSVLPVPFTPYKYPGLACTAIPSPRRKISRIRRSSSAATIQFRFPPVEMEEAGHRCCVAEEESQTAVSHQPMKRCGSVSTLSAADGCFDCNICLDYAVEPVVTLCGHLYCWPCIYKWLQSASPQQCPVCKAALSQTSLVPLYGRGDTTKVSTQGVPRRPPSAPRELAREPLPPMEHVSPQLLRMPMLHYATGGALGGMAIAVLPWVLRNHGVYNTSPPRVRRQEMQVERSLQQIWVFSLCCALLCLLLF